MSQPIAPPRFRSVRVWQPAVVALLVGFFSYSVWAMEVSLVEFCRGIPNAMRIVVEGLPPQHERLGSLSWRTFETLQIAFVGTCLGIVPSLLLASLASRAHAPGRCSYLLSRTFVAVCRSVPDIAWAVLFVAMVGPGTFAGVLTILVDSVGFCGRFYAEAMEEADPDPQEALRAAGAGRLGILAGAVLPTALPSMLNSSLFALERAVRTSLVVGLVGAGGIGIDLRAAMERTEYDQVATILLLIMILVVGTERVSALLRKRVL